MAQVAQRRSEWLQKIGLGRRYWECDRENMAGDPLGAYLEFLRTNAKNGRGVVLIGPPGTGKTGALAVIAKAAHSAGMPWEHVRYQTQVMLMQELGRRAKGERWEGDRAYSDWDKLLLLDEFGAAYESDWWYSLLEEYLSWRYDQVLPTCVATNLTVKALQETARYARVVDRWRETCDTIIMAGASLRAHPAVPA
jgi:DNA replication protein DnaC